jgi:DNA-binding ferritin-like protein
MALKLFPEEMKQSSTIGMTIESVAAKLSFFYEQAHLIHWQTTRYAEHQAIGSLYDKLVDFKDEIIEKLMGYEGRRPKAFKIEPLSDTTDCKAFVTQIKDFAYNLGEMADAKGYCDIKNISDSLSGEAAKTLYLLTLS